jgi:hypothetical protein
MASDCTQEQRTSLWISMVLLCCWHILSVFYCDGLRMVCESSDIPQHIVCLLSSHIPQHIVCHLSSHIPQHIVCHLSSRIPQHIVCHLSSQLMMLFCVHASWPGSLVLAELKRQKKSERSFFLASSWCCTMFMPPGQAASLLLNLKDRLNLIFPHKPLCSCWKTSLWKTE